MAEQKPRDTIDVLWEEQPEIFDPLYGLIRKVIARLAEGDEQNDQGDAGADQEKGGACVPVR